MQNNNHIDFLSHNHGDSTGSQGSGTSSFQIFDIACPERFFYLTVGLSRNALKAIRIFYRADRGDLRRD